MRAVYGFGFGKVMKEAERLINKCVEAKRGIKYVSLYAVINGHTVEIKEPILLYSYQINNADGTPIYENKSAE
jgi:hypothetical protein